MCWWLMLCKNVLVVVIFLVILLIMWYGRSNEGECVWDLGGLGREYRVGVFMV